MLFHDTSTYKEKFGWGRFRPAPLRFLATVQGMLALLVIASVVQSMALSGLVGSTISTIEKRYQLPSSRSALVSTVYDVTYAVAALLITFVIKTRRGKIINIAAGTFLLGVGLFLYSLPHFTVGLYNYGDAVSVTCDPASNSTFTACVEEERGLSDLLYVILLAQGVSAIGSMSIYVFGNDILESTSPQGSGGFYLGILSASRVAAGAVGFIVNGQLLNIFIDFNKPGNIPPSGGLGDARWLGAWWLGFPPLAAVAILTAPWILGLPGKISAEKKAIDEDVKGSLEKEESSEAKGLLRVLDFFKQLWSLVTNPIFVFMVLVGIGTNMCYTSLNTFGIKYVENQFAMSAGAASIASGLTIIPAGILGSVIGGLVMRKYKLGVTGSLKITLVGIACMFLLPLGFAVRCPNTVMAGVTVPYGNGSVPRTPVVGAAELVSRCTQDCPCPPAYNPVCGAGVEYFSPCLAGCWNASREQGYTSCSCYAGDEPVDVTDTFSVTSGRCSNGCTLLPLAMALLFLFSFGLGLANAPRTVIVLSCVQENQRSFALGIESVVRTFLGSVPAPLVFGALVDQACLLWDQNCGQRGACLMYDNALLSTYLAILMAALASWSFPCACLAMYFWKRRNTSEVYEVDRTENEKEI
ncbi:PREDICTED: solute carrier organic anion transporter family member 4A1-like [Branchiostoma belcheri]|uniref:Solute carrier organic anion transporter family member n=1 Tax=Branchiostoma belcheri TaxID=7741 RepID=A0A6P4ZL22_BRABE|nr:PREDICTED: solute carrier organic anion transporter family member 4A1-like [Branchiostoma belcheri]